MRHIDRAEARTAVTGLRVVAGARRDRHLELSNIAVDDVRIETQDVRAAYRSISQRTANAVEQLVEGVLGVVFTRLRPQPADQLVARDPASSRGGQQLEKRQATSLRLDDLAIHTDEAESAERFERECHSAAGDLRGARRKQAKPYATDSGRERKMRADSPDDA